MKKTFATLLCATVLCGITTSVAHADVFDDYSGWVDPCASVREELGTEKSNDSKEASWRKEVIKYAKEGIEGTKYSQSDRWRWQKSADCSSYAAMVYEKALGIKPSDFGESTHTQCVKLKKIKKEDAKEGDLAMWGEGASSHHVGIYNGNGKVYEMKDPTYNGQLTPLKGYYGGQPDDFYTIEGTSFGDKAIKKFDKESQSSDSDSNSDSDSSSEPSKSDGKGTVIVAGHSVRDYEKKVKTCYNYMHGKYGFSGQAVAGILGNWVQESGIEPKVTQGVYGRPSTDAECRASFGNPDVGLGLGQWTGGRHNMLLDFAEKHYKDKMEAFTLPVQLDYMFNGDGMDVLTLKKYALQAGDDPKDNAVQFQAMWERSADGAENIARRASAGATVWSDMKKWGLDGDKDTSKINKMKFGGHSDVSLDFAPTVASGGKTTDDICGDAKRSGGLSSDGDADYGGGWTQPIKGFNGIFSGEQDFGPCTSRQGNWHDGVDYGSMGFGSDKNLYAVHNGKIKSITKPGYGLGWYLVLDVGDQEVAYQEFTNNRSDIFVDEGDNVKAGQKIAKLDSVAGAGGVGTHLHLGITKKGGNAKEGLSHAFVDDGYWIDPMKVLPKKFK